MKKTALDDDAYLYQKREPKTEKQKWAEMNSAQRKQYFLDYYLLKIVLVTAAVVTVFFFIWNFISKSQEENVLYVAVIDESLEAEKLEAFTGELTEYLEADAKKQKVVIDDSFYTKDGALDKLQVYLANRQIDVVIADQDTYRILSGYGFFQDMDSVLGDRASEYSENYVEAAGYKESEDISFEDHETAQGEELPYGVDISGSRKFTDMSEYIGQPVLSVVQNAPNPENAVKFLDLIMENK